MKPIAIDEFCRLTFLSSPAFSPDGKTACFAASTVNKEKNLYESNLWVRRGGRLRQLNRLAACTLALDIVLNLLLIPRLGATGSAWSSLGAQTFMAVTQLALAVRLYRLPVAAFLPPRLTDMRQLIKEASGQPKKS